MTTEEIISKYKDVIDGLGCFPGELHLEVDNAALACAAATKTDTYSTEEKDHKGHRAYTVDQ